MDFAWTQSLVRSTVLTYPISPAENPSVHCDQTRVRLLRESRMKLRIIGRNVISATLTSAIVSPMTMIGTAIIRPTSAPALGSAYLKSEYAMPHHTMMIISWRSESPATIVSSFSICIGILYCIE